jgi:hypothetical protein
VVARGLLTAGVLVLALGAAGCGSTTASRKPTAATPSPVRPPAPSAQVEHALLAKIAAARSCLAKKAQRVSGGPVYPLQSPTSPDGELIVGTSRAGAFIAFYTTPTRAVQLEPVVRRNAPHGGGALDRRGTVTVLWIGHLAPRLRHAVLTCAFA